MTKPQANTFLCGVTDGIPIGLGYLSVSFAFGINAVSQGIPFIYVLLISMTNLTSAGQVAGVGVIAAGGTYAEIALTQLTINMRYALMSLSLSQKTDEKFSIKHRFLASFGITDEIFAVAASKPYSLSAKYMYGLITVPYIGWAAGTALGALAGNILPDIIKNALGIALYGMFIAIVIPPAKKHPRIFFVVILAVLLSCGFKYLPILQTVSGGFAIVLCAVIPSIIGALLFPVESVDSEYE